MEAGFSQIQSHLQNCVCDTSMFSMCTYMFHVLKLWPPCTIESIKVPLVVRSCTQNAIVSVFWVTKLLILSLHLV